MAIGKQAQETLGRIDKLRKYYGLQPIKKGRRKCLSCNKSFLSPDLVNQKKCNTCRLDAQ